MQTEMPVIYVEREMGVRWYHDMVCLMEQQYSFGRNVQRLVHMMTKTVNSTAMHGIRPERLISFALAAKWGCNNIKTLFTQPCHVSTTGRGWLLEALTVNLPRVGTIVLKG